MVKADENSARIVFPESGREVFISRWTYDSLQEYNLDEMIRELPDFRRRQALSFRFAKDRLLCAKTYLMLRECLHERFGIDVPVEFGYSGNGKPFLKGYEDIHFNISHCPKAAICAVGKQPVGCDIEVISPELDKDLCHHCFNDKETDMVLASENPNAEFTRIWTMKESYLKLKGDGLRDDLRDILSADIVSQLEFRTEIDLQGGTVTSVCIYR